MTTTKSILFELIQTSTLIHSLHQSPPPMLLSCYEVSIRFLHETDIL